VYGLGSCIVPILMDKKNKVFGISHILLPYANEKNSIAYPHKYANLSIKYLVKEMINHGVEIKNICAILIGGANIFQSNDCTVGKENIKIVKYELEKFNIHIIKEEIGGNKGRIVKFNPIDFSISVKLTGNDNFKLL
jgi:chemotaxis protein CheD